MTDAAVNVNIPKYNYESLIRSVTFIVNQSRRGLIDADDALDEIVRAYQDHSV